MGPDWIPSRIFQILEELPPISEDGTEAKSKNKKGKEHTKQEMTLYAKN